MSKLIHFIVGHIYTYNKIKYLEEVNGHRIEMVCVMCGKKEIYKSKVL